MNYRACFFPLVFLICLKCAGQNTITLRKSFIDSFKNQITITAQYDVWFTHHKANPPVKDGDIHAAGYDNKIGMPAVVEIMNAKEKQEGIDLFISHEGKGKANNPKLEVIGVWRLWPEHMGAGPTFFRG